MNDRTIRDNEGPVAENPSVSRPTGERTDKAACPCFFHPNPIPAAIAPPRGNAGKDGLHGVVECPDDG